LTSQVPLAASLVATSIGTLTARLRVAEVVSVTVTTRKSLVPGAASLFMQTRTAPSSRTFAVPPVGGVSSV
jgi:hypothetical protein